MFTKLKQRPTSVEKVNHLIETCSLIRNNKYDQPKVGKFEDSNQIVKFYWLDNKSFFRKYIYTVSRKLVSNAERIQKLKFTTTVPNSWYRCNDLEVEFVLYDFIPGQTIYHIIDETQSCDILKPFAQYVAKVHRAGIYFRAGHLDNFLYHEGEFSMIDVDNAQFGISIRQRAKNLTYMYSHSIQNKYTFFDAYDFDRFVQEYLEAAQLSKSAIKKFQSHLN